ncbi:YdeI/OmpD-associated family protein [Ornithinibacillus sp. 4-3]|uniref:YdeI/OmpD-associated family protein n=1 Tax=Ornithinibacillus sp. 4-3 TaxID=3231488 RepID=A0AB39HS91_9BACI
MSIIDKLKLSKYKNLVVINEPKDYQVFKDYSTTLDGLHDAIFVFVETLEEMVDLTQEIIHQQKLAENGYLFFAYPKKGNKRYPTFIHRDEIFPAMNVNEEGFVGKSDYKFSRMVSMDEVFTVIGIKKDTKKPKKSTAASQRVEDYVNKVDDIKAILATHPEELSFYKSLTPGYQKDWARYIYSAKQEATQQKRIKQMIDILAQKYKSISLYQQKK